MICLLRIIQQNGLMTVLKIIRIRTALVVCFMVIHWFCSAQIRLTRFETTGITTSTIIYPEALKLIQLANEQNGFAIEWTSVQTIPLEDLNFECKLEPVGKKVKWEKKGSSRQAIYSNLVPGAYTFFVRVMGSNVPPFALSIAIAPAWWQTSWFKLLLLALSVTIGYLIWLYREKQRHLEQQRELAVQNAIYKTRFLANISHEIRTPMNAILGMSRLLTEKALPEQEAAYAEAIRQSAENLLVIINDVLDQAKIESGKFSFKQKPFELDVILLHLKNTIGFKATEKGLVFDIQINPGTPVQLIGDSVRLNQILTNLLGNAIKFTEKGTVRLNVEAAHAGAFPGMRIPESLKDAILLRFVVTDTGIGIHEAQIPHVFESFRQANDEISTSFGGTGLGLSISKDLIEQQGGKIEIKSETGFGTQVEVWLPFAVNGTDTQALKPKAVDFQLGSKLKILLVEDTYFNQILAVELLKKNIPDAEIDLAENGQVALEKLKTATTYDLVLMDIKMPVMDGLEATRRLRNMPGGNQIPVVALTANAVQDELEKCKTAGMNAWVTKPIEIDKLLETIKQVLPCHKV